MLVTGKTMRLTEGRGCKVDFGLYSPSYAVWRCGRDPELGADGDLPREADHRASAATDSCDATGQVASSRARPAAEP